MEKKELELIQKISKSYSVFPLCRKINADTITPILMIKKLSKISQYYYLLESVGDGKRWGRYSFLGFDPLMRVSCKNGVVLICQNSEIKSVKTSSPLDIVRDILKEYKTPKLEDMPPFTGGFVGYFSYSMIGYTQPKLKLKKGDENDFNLMLFDKVIAYDNLKQQINIIANIKTDNIKENIVKANLEIDRIIEIITDTSPCKNIQSSQNVDFICNTNKDDFCKSVEKTKKYIKNGEIFQAVISRRFESPYDSNLLNAYRMLRIENPSPYMVYMNIGNEEIMGTSPETLVKLQDGRLSTFPIAGSRPRGKTKQEDLWLEKDLLSDEKEISEHNMLVDLGRNDLGKISVFSSVKVTKYMMINRYSKIMHICSRVEGDIKKEFDACSAIEAVLPAGTLSGAPKIRACEIIDELEKEPQEIYGGAFGYLDFTGNMDTCIAIRMAVKKDGKVTIQAGAGIVADSIPEKEYEEIENKALAVINSICSASEVDEQWFC